jgi:exodeoxyribonuclease V alpha subunit
MSRDTRMAERLVTDLLRRRFGVADEVVLRLAGLTVRAAAAGHSCLELDRLDAGLVASFDARRGADGGERTVGADDDGAAALPKVEVALAALRACPAVHVVETGGSAAAGSAKDGRERPIPGQQFPAAPLVLDGLRLATHREYRSEQRIVAALARRAAAVTTAAPLPLTAHAITGDTGQVAAIAQLCAAGRSSGVGVLAGGPGTGKTTTVAALLAARLEAHLADPAHRDLPLRIALAAPTGKAAARLTESVRAATPEVARVHGDEVAARLRGLDATTVHRLLDIGRDGLRREEVPIPADLVIVDEASMLGLPLAATLLDALADDAHLVLVGDPDQLMSVETGSVLRALVEVLAGAEDRGPVAVLRVNHRLTREDPRRDAFVHAVRDGDAEGALALLAEVAGAAQSGAATVEDARGTLLERPSLHWIDIDDPSSRADEVIAPILDDGAGGGFLPALTAALGGEGGIALAALGAVRLLCGHRHGPFGTTHWNAVVRRRLAKEAGVAGGGARTTWLPGEPVMVLANDDRTGLVNGDTGIVVGSGTARRLVFERRDGELLERAVTALPDIASAYAVTVHKSQGSEFGTVVVVLPPPDSPLAVRELLYTALTRARSRVVLVGSAAAVRAAITHRSLRMGGLAVALAAQRDTSRAASGGSG